MRAKRRRGGRCSKARQARHSHKFRSSSSINHPFRCRTPLHHQILDLLGARALEDANRINHFKQATSKPKLNDKYVDKMIG